jgi:hydroxylaminobenzene mutase
MTERETERALSRAGVLLILLALVTGLAIPAFANPRQALAAHVSAILGGLLLVGLASLWSRLTLSASRRTLTMRLAIAGTYANLLGSLLAASWGTTRLTPLAGAGYGAAPWKETIAQVIQVSQGIALLVALGLVVYGLRSGAADSPAPRTPA